MNNKTLLISTNTVREITPIGDNTNDKQLTAAIREAQNVGLRNIIGSGLLERLKEMVDDGSIYGEENGAYSDLLDECQWYLAYQTVVRLLPQLQFKVDNAGVILTDDEHMRNLGVDETFTVVDYYQKRADYYCLLLQQWILNHKSNFPELDACTCERIGSNLHSSFTSGLWMGGRVGGNRMRRCGR